MQFRLTRQRLFVLWAVVLLLADRTFRNTRYWWWTWVWFILPLIVQLVRFPRFVRIGMTEAIEADRMKQGQCLKCGYDLRGSPARCPECGAIAS